MLSIFWNFLIAYIIWMGIRGDGRAAATPARRERR